VVCVQSVGEWEIVEDSDESGEVVMWVRYGVMAAAAMWRKQCNVASEA